jgi:hypothetical protein
LLLLLLHTGGGSSALNGTMLNTIKREPILSWSGDDVHGIARFGAQ